MNRETSNNPDFTTDLPAPNHHADHAGFSGPTGLLCAVMFMFGRDKAAQLAIDSAGLRAGDHLVDVGCGPGSAARRARKLGAEVIGVDPATVMLRVARLRSVFGRRLTWRLGTAEAIPVADDWATVVWSLATVHHWADIDAGLAEARRVLQPDGRLVVLERRIRSTDVAGTASHGWTQAQAESFAATCRRHDFENVIVAEHETGKMTILSVVAHLSA